MVMFILVVLIDFGRRKTKPIYSYCVLRAAYCVLRKWKLKKQSQITPKGVVWRPGDCCSRDIVVFEQEIWYKAYV
jgi:hypothetical protein